MKKKVDWKELGQFLSVVVNFFAVIRDTLKPMQIGIEIIPWLIGSGKESFVQQCVVLGQEFLRQGSLPGKTFMTIKFGQYPTVDTLYNAIMTSGKKIGYYANQILHESSLSTIEESVILHEVTVAELGFKEATALEIVWKRILDVGYILCSAEAMALARIKCNDDNCRIGVMEPIILSGGDLYVLGLYSHGDVLWLDAHRISPDSLLNPDCILVVALPPRK